MNGPNDMTKRTPVDVWIVVCLEVISSLISFGVFVLILTGIAHAPSESPGRVLLNTVCLSSDLSMAVYSLLEGVASLCAAYGLIGCRRWAWWFVLGLTALNTVDAAYGIGDYPISAGIGSVFGVVIILWLLLRKGLFFEAKE
jgi:hypothetical protein